MTGLLVVWPTTLQLYLTWKEGHTTWKTLGSSTEDSEMVFNACKPVTAAGWLIYRNFHFAGVPRVPNLGKHSATEPYPEPPRGISCLVYIAIIYFHKCSCMCAGHSTWLEVSRQLSGGQVLLPCGCQVPNSGDQACQQTPSSAESPHRPKTDICDLGQKTKVKEFPLCVHTLSPSKPWSVKYVWTNMALTCEHESTLSPLFVSTRCWLVL